MTVHKSEEMAAHAEKYGWRTAVRTDLEHYEETGNVEDIKWILFAIRGEEDKQEILKVRWWGDLQESAFYKYGDYSLRPARKAPVLKLIEGQPNPKKFRKEEKKSKPATVEDKLAGKSVPWEGDDSPAFDILLGVIGHTITWIGSDGEERTQSCPKASNLGKAHFKVKTTKAGKRVLEWANSFGFHACYVDSIIVVV
ncbi:hypothetical protein CL65_gp075 [Mycobacterium phage Patience]|uniref:Uncharacterized protein n=1 Tax=Mycobacterium phage Patience TaxID=1074308 RepID=G1JWI5_9CAUD|nr:hypothetical protein CL65_gp075 [Mycobacterium phage Patience]AEL97983.1 hypothetical protein PATIENCE_74 [Mycobacterium phage Patience]